MVLIRQYIEMTSFVYFGDELALNISVVL